MFRAFFVFFIVLVAIFYCVGKIAGSALKPPDMVVLRSLVMFCSALVSAGVAYWDWKIQSDKNAAKTAQLSGKDGGPVVPGQSSSTSSSKPQSSTLAAAGQAIVFHQDLPPRRDDSALSFLGGRPLAPVGLKWPAIIDQTGKDLPLTFIMQINCADIPAPARLGLMPDKGVLYFFLDLVWGNNGCRVLYEPDVTAVVEIATPDNLSPVYGDEGKYTFPWLPVDELPQILPKWTFKPVVIQLPALMVEPDEEGVVYWPGEGADISQLLYDVQGVSVTADVYTLRDLTGPGEQLIRPYDEFPHDYNCIRVVAGLLAERISRESKRNNMDEGSPAAAALTSAKEWQERAARHNPWAKVPEDEADEFWQWLEDHAPLAMYALPNAISTAIECTIESSHESEVTLHPAVLERVRYHHSLAYKGEQGTNATCPPDRMLSAPSDVQGNQYEISKTHLLLLELSSNRGIAHRFGEGVYQMWITPDDLKHCRFENVVLTCDAY